MTDVLMPRLSDSMEEGTIIRWLKADGDDVSRGEEIVEIETDKATMAYEADAAGRLSIVATEGATLPVGTVIATIGDRADTAAAPAAAPGGARPAAAPAPPRAVREPREAGAVSASPVARRTAARLGVDLSQVRGTGPHGRVHKADVLAAAAASPAPAVAPPRDDAAPRPAAAGPAAAVAPVEDARGAVTAEPLTRTQSVVARRMAESRSTIPAFELRMEIDMEACVALRAQLKEHRAGDAVPSLNDFVVKACALALRDHPRANGSYRDGRFELYERVNVGVAVAAADALVVPTVRDADRKSLGAIAAETRMLAERVRDGSISPQHLAGGTFTVSNLGMFGVTSFTAIVNPPQAAILAVGAVAPRPVVRDGAIVARATMDVTLACDHRILYGADAARFLARIRELLEQPMALLL